MINIDTLQIVDTLKVLTVNSSDPFPFSTMVNVVLIIINIATGIYLNFFAFNKRKQNDRVYQVNFDLYKSLVINNLNKFISHCGAVELILKDTINTDKIGEERIELIQTKYTIVENIQEDFYRVDLPFITSYSKEMSNNIKDATEEFYNKTAEILSRFGSPVATREWSILMEFSRSKDKYYDNIFTLIKKYQPNKSL